MGIKKDRLLRIGHKLLPSKLKGVLIKHGIAKSIDEARRFIYKDDDIIEFSLPGFNDNGLIEPFKHITALYDLYLKDDNYWHFIYEGSYSLIRCSYKYAEKVEKYLDKHKINHKPIEWWNESTYVTTKYNKSFRDIFHMTSVLVIKMAKNKDKDFYISQAADRLVHIFLLQAIYLAEINGDLDRFREINYDVEYWEAEHMSTLTRFRAYNIGKIDGQRALTNYWDSLRKEQNEEQKI